MAYHAAGSDDGSADVTDQFFLGPDLIVAPVIAQGATARTVVLPEGRWRADDGTVLEGPAQVTVPCDLTRLPRFERLPAG
jgi:alpha-glucosidase (family GH31 glycosyl hydrolase)